MITFLGKDEISKEISLNEVVCGRIILVKDDFLLAICENGGRNARKTLVYLPSRLHPNTIPPKDGMQSSQTAHTYQFGVPSYANKGDFNARLQYGTRASRRLDDRGDTA